MGQQLQINGLRPHLKRGDGMINDKFVQAPIREVWSAKSAAVAGIINYSIQRDGTNRNVNLTYDMKFGFGLCNIRYRPARD